MNDLQIRIQNMKINMKSAVWFKQTCKEMKFFGEGHFDSKEWRRGGGRWVFFSKVYYFHPFFL